MRIALRVEGIEAVAEDAGRVVRDERVLPPPAPPVARVVGVEVDEPAVTVERRPVAVGVKAVDGTASVREPAEEVVEAPAVDPVRPDLEPGDRPRPVREVELERPLDRKPGREAEVGQPHPPGLDGPVRAVRSAAGLDDEAERRPVVGTAAVREPDPRRTSLGA